MSNSYAHPYLTDVFFSYSTKDDDPNSKFVRPGQLRGKIHDQLKQLIRKPCGYKTWLDRDDMQNGGSLSDQIRDAITTTAVLVVFLSRNYMESDWCCEELAQFARRCRWPRAVRLQPDRLVIVSLDGSSAQTLADNLEQRGFPGEGFADVMTELAYTRGPDGRFAPLAEDDSNQNQHNLPYSALIDRLCLDVFGKLSNLRKNAPSVFLGYLSDDAPIPPAIYLERLESFGVRAEYQDFEPAANPQEHQQMISNKLGNCDLFVEISKAGSTPMGTAIPSYQIFQTDVLQQLHGDCSSYSNPYHIFWNRDNLPRTPAGSIHVLREGEYNAFQYFAREAKSRRFWRTNRVSGVWDLLVIADPSDIDFIPRINDSIDMANSIRRQQSPAKADLTVYFYEEDPPAGEMWNQILFRPAVSMTENLSLPWNLAISIFAASKTHDLNKKLNAWSAEIPKISALRERTSLLNVKFSPPAPASAILQRPPKVNNMNYDTQQLANFLSAL